MMVRKWAGAHLCVFRLGLCVEFRLPEPLGRLRHLLLCRAVAKLRADHLRRLRDGGKRVAAGGFRAWWGLGGTGTNAAGERRCADD